MSNNHSHETTYSTTERIIAGGMLAGALAAGALGLHSCAAENTDASQNNITQMYDGVNGPNIIGNNADSHDN